MAREKNPAQIIRLDGKDCFFEVMNTGFEIDKVLINFVQYDTSKEKNSRITAQIPIYIDISKFLVLAQDILSGKMAGLAKKAKDDAESRGSKYASHIYADMGGVSARVLESRGKSRPDGKSLSRQLKITPGAKMPWLLSAEMGVGEEDERGLIVPRYGTKPEQRVQVPLTDDDFKRFALTVKAHIEAYFASQYVLRALNPQTQQDGNSKTA